MSYKTQFCRGLECSQSPFEDITYINHEIWHWLGGYKGESWRGKGMENTYVCKCTYKRQMRHFSEEKKPQRRGLFAGASRWQFKKKSLNWMERSPQGTWKDVMKLSNNWELLQPSKKEYHFRSYAGWDLLKSMASDWSGIHCPQSQLSADSGKRNFSSCWVILNSGFRTRDRILELEEVL